MSTINYTYNVIVDRFRQFAAGHFQLRRFTHGEISQADLEKEAEWPWMHVKPRAINYSPGTRAFSFEVFISDLPRDKEDKTGYQAESITDCSLIFQDLINEIHLGHMFGDDVVLTRPVNSEPFVEQYTHTLTGVTGTIELNLDYDWSACSIPASWNYNTPTDSGSDGWGALQFVESLDQNGVFVSLLNDEEAPGNSYYYGTDAAGIKGWYAIVDNIGLTCETLPDCATIISILEDIEALQTDVALKANTADLGATAFSNDYNDLDNLPTIPAAQVNSDWNAVSGVSEILNKPTIPSIAGLVPETRTLTINGTTQDLSADRTFTIATGLTVGTTPITSGTVGRVLFEGTGNVLQQSGSLFWDNTNARLGVGTATPAYALDVLYTSSNSTGNNAVRVLATNSAATAEFRVENNLGSSGRMFILGSTYANYKTLSANDLGFYKATSGNISILCDVTVGRILLTAGASTTAHQTIFANGNVGIGTTTDAGFKLDVNGTVRVQGNAQFGTGFYWDNTNNRLGVGTAVPNSRINALDGTVSELKFNSGFLNLTPSLAVGNTGSGGKFACLIAGTNAAAFIYDSAGYFDIATDLKSNYTANNLGGSNYVSKMRVQSNGNVQIGTTTDAGYKLDVNGTARVVSDSVVQGRFSIGTTSFVDGLRIARNPTSASSFSTFINVAIQNTVTSSYRGVATSIGLLTSGFTLPNLAHYECINDGTFTAGVVTNLYGFRESMGTYNATNVYGFHGSVTAASNRWNLYMSGSALNYFNGSLLIGTTTDIASSKLTIDSTTQGFLPPRMTTTQKNAIATPAAGLVVYDTTLGKLCVRGAASWETITSL